MSYLSFYCNIFLSQYCVQHIVCDVGLKERMRKIFVWRVLPHPMFPLLMPNPEIFSSPFEIELTKMRIFFEETSTKQHCFVKWYKNIFFQYCEISIHNKNRLCSRLSFGMLCTYLSIKLQGCQKGAEENNIGRLQGVGNWTKIITKL